MHAISRRGAGPRRASRGCGSATPEPRPDGRPSSASAAGRSGGLWAACCSRRSRANPQPRGVRVRPGTRMDATLIAYAGIRRDGEARLGRAPPPQAPARRQGGCGDRRGGRPAKTGLQGRLAAMVLAYGRPVARRGRLTQDRCVRATPAIAIDGETGMHSGDRGALRPSMHICAPVAWCWRSLPGGAARRRLRDSTNGRCPMPSAARYPAAAAIQPPGGSAMSWKKPVIAEICLGLEINAYASATV